MKPDKSKQQLEEWDKLIAKGKEHDRVLHHIAQFLSNSDHFSSPSAKAEAKELHSKFTKVFHNYLNKQ